MPAWPAGGTGEGTVFLGGVELLGRLLLLDALIHGDLDEGAAEVGVDHLAREGDQGLDDELLPVAV